MKTPDLQNIFINDILPNTKSTELKKAECAFDNRFDKTASDYQIPFEVADEIRDAASEVEVVAQYLGFIQGFSLSMRLLLQGLDNGTNINNIL